MPHVQITWVEGRTPEQKRKVAERVTTVLIEDGKAKRENIHVSFHDVPSTNYAEAGVLLVSGAIGFIATFGLIASIQADRDIWTVAAFGIIPLAVGIGYFVDWSMIRRDMHAPS